MAQKKKPRSEQPLRIKKTDSNTRAAAKHATNIFGTIAKEGVSLIDDIFGLKPMKKSSRRRR